MDNFGPVEEAERTPLANAIVQLKNALKEERNTMGALRGELVEVLDLSTILRRFVAV